MNQQPRHEDSENHVQKESGHTGEENTSTQMDEQMARDLPLYSPVTKSLFAHLDQRGDDAPDWNPLNFLSSIRKGLAPEYWPMKLRQEQQSPDVMRTIQYLVYNDLNCQPNLLSDYSLLPYILFSPYSPLKLSAGNLPNSPLFQTKIDPEVDQFPYCEAFQDLIATVYGTPHPWTPLGVDYDFQPPNVKMPFFFDNNSPSIKAVAGKFYIDNLGLCGLLQQKERKSISHMVQWPSPWASPSLQTYGKHLSDIESAAETEQEMYDRFLSAPARIASNPSRIRETLALLIDDAGNIIEKQVQSLEKSPEGNQHLREFLDTRLAKDILRMIQKTKGMAEPPQPIEKSESAAPDVPAKPITNASKVVATSTTSERNEDEDGSVETTVTVWKRFADGRESTTTTTHFEDATRWRESEEGSKDLKSENKSDEKKTGWFWN